jgi:dolichol-phosphate mannosyltransferase
MIDPFQQTTKPAVQGVYTAEKACVQLSVVIPVFNEEENVLDLATEVLQALEGTAHEIIFVDDGSGDSTAILLIKLTAAQPRVRLIRHRFNCGQSAAIVTGVRSARAPWVATLDGDGQNDPADIAKLLAVARDISPPPVCVCGERRQRQDSWSKRVSSRIANRVRSRLLGDRIADTGCGLKLFRREAFLELPRFDHMHRFLPALFLRDGRKVVSVPVNHRPRRHGVSKYGLHNRLWVGLVDLLGVLWLQRRGRRPERLPEEKPL